MVRFSQPKPATDVRKSVKNTLTDVVNTYNAIKEAMNRVSDQVNIVCQRRQDTSLDCLTTQEKRILEELNTMLRDLTLKFADVCGSTNGGAPIFNGLPLSIQEEIQKKQSKNRHHNIDGAVVLEDFIARAKQAQARIQELENTLKKIDPENYLPDAKNHLLKNVELKQCIVDAHDALQETQRFFDELNALNEGDVRLITELKGIWEDFAHALVDTFAARNPQKEDADFADYIVALHHLLGKDYPAAEHLISRIQKLEAEGRSVGKNQFASLKNIELIELSQTIPERIYNLRQQQKLAGGALSEKDFVQVWSEVPTKYTYDIEGQTYLFDQRIFLPQNQVRFDKNNQMVPAQESTAHAA